MDVDVIFSSSFFIECYVEDRVGDSVIFCIYFYGCWYDLVNRNKLPQFGFDQVNMCLMELVD